MAHRDGAHLEIRVIQMFDRQILVPLEEALDALGVAVVSNGVSAYFADSLSTIGVVASP